MNTEPRYVFDLDDKPLYKHMDVDKGLTHAYLLYKDKVYHMPVTRDHKYRFVKVVPEHVDRFLKFDDRSEREKALAQMVKACKATEHFNIGRYDTCIYVPGHDVMSRMMASDTFAVAIEFVEATE